MCIRFSLRNGDEESLALLLYLVYLVVYAGGAVLHDGACHHIPNSKAVPAHPAHLPQVALRTHEHVGHVLKS